MLHYNYTLVQFYIIQLFVTGFFIPYIDYINAARYGNYYHSSYRYTCLNDHKTLSQCTDDAYSISQYYNAVGVKCSTILTGIIQKELE